VEEVYSVVRIYIWIVGAYAWTKEEDACVEIVVVWSSGLVETRRIPMTVES
jgi:hypothetical protein